MKGIINSIQFRMAKCVILALNIKENPYEYGTDEMVFKIIDRCKQRNVPIVHACTRKGLGKRVFR